MRGDTGNELQVIHRLLLRPFRTEGFPAGKIRQSLVGKDLGSNVLLNAFFYFFIR